MVAKFEPPGLIQPSYQQEDLRAKQKTGKEESWECSESQAENPGLGQERSHPCSAPRNDRTIRRRGAPPGQSGPISPVVSLKACSRIEGTHALWAEARRGDGACDQQAQQEQQRYKMHGDGPRGGSRYCDSRVPLKPAGRYCKAWLRSALRPAGLGLQALGGTSLATPQVPPASVPPSTAYCWDRACGGRGGAEC